MKVNMSPKKKTKAAPSPRKTTTKKNPKKKNPKRV
jgi:hypothetical protein